MKRNQCIVVTGGARGIGRAISLELARNGYDIVINYLNSKESAEELKSEIIESGGDAKIIQADVSNFEQSKALLDFALESFGNVYGLINNAGITKDNLIMRMSEKDYDDVLNANLKSAFNCTKHATSIMIRAKKGRIVSLSSIAGVYGNAGQANYSASKAGIIGLTKAVAKEVAPRGITVNAIAPGFIGSDMTDKLTDTQKNNIIAAVPLKRIGKAEEVAKLAAFLCSDDAAYITGQIIGIDGGLVI